MIQTLLSYLIIFDKESLPKTSSSEGVASTLAPHEAWLEAIKKSKIETSFTLYTNCRIPHSSQGWSTFLEQMHDGNTLSLPIKVLIYFHADMVDDDIPVLHGMHVMKQHGIVLDLEQCGSDCIMEMKPSNCIHYRNWFAPLQAIPKIFARPEQIHLHFHFFDLGQARYFVSVMGWPYKSKYWFV